MQPMITTLLIWGTLLNLPMAMCATNPCCSYPCQNKGICTSSGEHYDCDCTRTGYFGKNCHRATWSTSIESLYSISPQTKLEIVTGYAPLWFVINLFGYLHRKATAYIYTSRGKTIITPHTHNINHDYITMDVYYNRSFYARDLPPIPCGCPTAMGTKGPVDLPPVSALMEKIFRRKKFIPERYGTNMIFVGYAQHFIHQFFKTDYERGLGYTAGDEGVDVSQIYGSDETARTALRSHIDGKLKTRNIDGEEFPPYSEDAPEVKITIPKDPELQRRVKAGTQCAFGNPIFNMSPISFVLATIWIREHNRICEVLRKKNHSWPDEKIYQTTRLIITGEMLTITMSEYVQQLSQYKIRLSYQPELTHDTNIQYSNRIRHEFNHLYNWHQLMPEEITVLNKTYNIGKLIYTGFPEILWDGFDNWVLAMTNTIAGTLTARNFGPATDTITKMVVEEGRDIRLQSFNNYRKRFGLKPYGSFEELTGESEIAKELRNLYNDVDAVEYYVGLVCEKHFKSISPATMIAMGGPWAIKGIMANPIGSPDWWKPSTFGGEEGFEMVKQATLKKLFCRNMKSKCENVQISFKVPPEIHAKLFTVVYTDSLNK